MLFQSHNGYNHGEAGEGVAEFATEYESELSELTFNSKPIINNLTIIAGENINAADQIVKIIEKRIRTVEPDMKLPSMYLLDSICKNIGGVYPKLFAQNIASIFSDTYRKSDAPTRNSLNNLKKTWVNLFAPHVLQQLDTKINAILSQPTARQPKSPSVHVNPNFVGKIPQQQQHSPESNAPQRRQKQKKQVNTPSPSSSNRVDEILQGQIRTKTAAQTAPPVRSFQHQQQHYQQPPNYLNPVVEQQMPAPLPYQTQIQPIPMMLVPQQQNFAPQQDTQYLQLQFQQQLGNILNEIQHQINNRSLTQQEQMNLYTQIQRLQQLQQQPLMGMSVPMLQSQIQTLQSMYPVSNIGNVGNDFQDHLHSQSQMPVPNYVAPTMPVNNFAPPTSLPYGVMPPVSQQYYQPPVTMPQPPVNDLLNNLQAYGFLKQNSTTAPIQQSTSTGSMTRPIPPTAPTQRQSTQAPLPKKSRVGKDLWSPDVLKRRDDSVINEFYFDFPLQCKNCGQRFADRHKMDLHLDWHFVQNRKEKEKTRKAMSRSWFLERDEWISAADISEKSAVPFPFGDGVLVAEEKKETVSVPADENQTNCPKCGESFEQYWDSDLDEWMYRHCVLVDGIIYHQKCSVSTDVEPDLRPKPISISSVEPSKVESALTSLQSNMPSLADSTQLPPVSTSISGEMPPLEDHDINQKKRTLQENEQDTPIEDAKRLKITTEEGVVVV